MSDEDSSFPYRGHRLSPGPTTGGQVFDWEDVPEELREDPKFWYAHYRNIESSYRDLLAIQQREQTHQQHERSVLQSHLVEQEDTVEEVKSIVGIGAGMFTIPYSISTIGNYSVPPTLLFGGAVTLTYVADRLAVPKLLRQAKNKMERVTNN
ncbi:hypothetical protein [Halomicrobium salinisoli]|uniref:hypothetical protein n=1 Tax=Halomicrobium salinisoli TaxID=2878391 RepID=UPI001CF03585|nr:hypothetical protein [Halomicrobium salinisoli]